MNMLKKVLGRDEKFFDLLEASAAEAHASASHLVHLMDDIQKATPVEKHEEFLISRRKDKKITQEITEQLCLTFMTPLDREDIESLSSSLYRIPKTVFKISERLMIFPDTARKQPALKELTFLLDKAAEEVSRMVKELRNGSQLDKVKEMNLRLQQFEGESDALYLKLLKELYDGRLEPRDVFLLKDVFELLERAIDRCRDAGNVVLQIVLKNS